MARPDETREETMSMTDLEITKLCASAAGLVVIEQMGAMRFPNTQFEYSLYCPLHDDAQAMALVKKIGGFQIFQTYSPQTSDYRWIVEIPQYGDKVRSASENLNRAICECCAKMQAAK